MESNARCEGAGADAAVFDYAASLEQIGGDPALLEVLIAAHLEQEPRLSQRLDEAMQGGEAVAVRKAAHALASSVSVLCAARARGAAKHLESLASQGELSALPAAREQLRREFRLLDEFLRSPQSHQAA